MCRSMTYAQQSQKLLERAGISAAVVKAPQGLNTSGCGYAVTVYRRAAEAIALLKSRNLINGRIFRHTEQGEYIEVK